MAAVATHRLFKDLQDIRSADFPLPEFSVDLVDDNIYTWRVYMLGPSNTKYQNVVFQISINFPQEYPMKPPHAMFKTKIDHPNIDELWD